MRDLSGASAEAQQAIHNINTGNTPYQRRRELNRKIGMGIAQAGLTGVQGLMKNVESRDLQEAQDAANKKRLTDAAIKNAKLPPSRPDDTPRDEYGLPVAPPDYSKSMDAAVAGGIDRAREEARYAPKPEDIAKQVSASNDVNDAAANAPFAGQWTQNGFSGADAQAAVNASDIQRAQAMMKSQSLQDRTFGGLRNSLAGGN